MYYWAASGVPQASIPTPCAHLDQEHGSLTNPSVESQQEQRSKLTARPTTKASQRHHDVTQWEPNESNKQFNPVTDVLGQLS